MQQMQPDISHLTQGRRYSEERRSCSAIMMTCSTPWGPRPYHIYMVAPAAIMQYHTDLQYSCKLVQASLVMLVQKHTWAAYAINRAAYSVKAFSASHRQYRQQSVLQQGCTRYNLMFLTWFKGIRTQKNAEAAIQSWWLAKRQGVSDCIFCCTVTWPAVA